MILGCTCGIIFTASLYFFGHASGFPAPLIAGTYPLAPATITTFGIGYLLARKRLFRVENFLKRYRDYMTFIFGRSVCPSIISCLVRIQTKNPIIISLMAIFFPIVKLFLRYSVYGTVLQRFSAHLDLTSKMCNLQSIFLARCVYQ